MSSRPRHTSGLIRRLAGLAFELTPQIFAVLAFGAGALMLASAVTPEFDSRLRQLTGVVSPILIDLIMGLCEKYEVDGIVFHATRTCRAFTNPMFMIAQEATSRLGIQTTMFEGDVADETFYKDELLNTRVEAMLEAIDQKRLSAF